MIKRLFSGLVSLLMIGLGLTFATPILAEQIDAYDVTATLANDRTATITEKINYDFGKESRHGIYRIIPDTYDRNGGKYRLRFEVVSIKLDGKDVPWERKLASGEVNLKIGDADKTLTGKHVYTIEYATKKAINDFKDNQEFYWNVTGNGWNVPIKSASMTITSPASSTKQVCYTGAYGSDISNCKLTVTNTTVTAKTNAALNQYEGLTLVAAYPLGTFYQLSWQEKAIDFLYDNLALLSPIGVFLIMLAIWYILGRDPGGRGTVIPHYEEPAALAPAEMSTILDQTVSEPAITATILDLARRGYLKIKYTTKKGLFGSKTVFTLLKLKEADGNCKPFETEILDGLFSDGDEVDPNKVEDFWESVQTMREDIFKTLKSKNWMLKNPAVVRGTWTAIATVVGTVGLIASGFFGSLMIVSGIVSGLIVFAFGWIMPRVTKQGAAMIEEVKGFKWFLNVTEKARLEFHNAPAKTPELFERFLPAAIAFGVEKQWAEQFKGMKIKPSYMDGDDNSFAAGYYANLSNDLNHTSSSGMYRAPSSGGSGSSGFSGGGSGGGFGGGGGGSW